MATALSSLIKGLFRLTCPPTAAGSWRNLSPGPRAHLEASILEGGPGLTKPQAQGTSNPPFHVGWGAGGGAISDERGKMETPAPWLQREALLGWNPGAGSRWPLQLRTACRVERRQGPLLGASETPSRPSRPNSAQGKQIFEKFTQAGTGRLRVGCLHAGTAQGRGAWEVIPGRPEELTLTLALPVVF